MQARSRSPAGSAVRWVRKRACSVRMTLSGDPRFLLELEHLIRRGPLTRQLALAVRQDDLHVHLRRLAQAEVRVRRLAGGVAVARGDLAAAQQRLRLAQLAL